MGLGGSPQKKGKWIIVYTSDRGISNSLVITFRTGGVPPSDFATGHMFQHVWGDQHVLRFVNNWVLGF